VVRVRVVDAFTERLYAGSPAAVCVLPNGPWPSWMQQVAHEMNHTATAFARPGQNDGWDLRWFSTVTELDLCGHGTLATAFVLHGDKAIDGSVRFDTKSGPLHAEVQPDGTVTMTFPAAPPTAAPEPPGLAAALGTAPSEVYRTGALGDLLVVLPDEKAVRAAAPDLGAVADLTRNHDIRGVILTAPADGDDGYDFVSRFFAPALGIPEDPVTGSTHTALAPYWSSRLGRDSLIGYQASARGGTVRTTTGRGTVLLSGRAVTVLDGELRTSS
jgi:PhzF family phenazine biosynthesis protein